MTTLKHTPILGEMAWRTGLDEVFATRALEVILRNASTRSAAFSLIEDRAKRPLTSVASLHPEASHAELGRPDLVGKNEAERTIFILEAKVAAQLELNQIQRYLNILETEAPANTGVLVLLVPESRLADAKLSAQRSLTEGVESPYSAAIVCLSWDELLDALVAGLHPEQDGGTVSVLADVAQLRALVHARTKMTVSSIKASLAEVSWDAALPLFELVDHATRQLAERSAQERGPLINRGDTVFTPAYYLRAPGPLPKTYYTFGVHKQFAQETGTPLWVRFNKTTAGGKALPLLHSMLANSKFAQGKRIDQGHLWVPIHAPVDLNNEELVNAVVQEVEALLALIPPWES